MKVLEALLEAQNQSYVLGLKLNLSCHNVEAIHSKYSDPYNRLLHVIIAFLKQENPTWKEIVEALRNPTINLPALAKKVEEKHILKQVRECVR